MGELLAYCDKGGMGASRDDILDHLLDRVIPAAYAQPPGEPIPAYTAESARNVLGRLAARMNQDETRDLQWWRLRAIIPSPARIFAASLVCGFVGLLTGALCAGALKIEFLAQNDPATGGARLAFTYLCLRWHTPLRLMRFLEDATDCGVLRTVGPTYQFRHARLQDRLASTTPLPTRKCGVSKLGYRS